MSDSSGIAGEGLIKKNQKLRRWRWGRGVHHMLIIWTDLHHKLWEALRFDDLFRLAGKYKIVKTMVGSWQKLHQTYSDSQVYTRPNLRKSRVKHKVCLFETLSSIHLLTSHLHTPLRSFYEPHAHKTFLDLGSDEKMQARVNVTQSEDILLVTGKTDTFFWCRDPDLRSQNVPKYLCSDDKGQRSDL